jgi:hypothetical protein
MPSTIAPSYAVTSAQRARILETRVRPQRDPSHRQRPRHRARGARPRLARSADRAARAPSQASGGLRADVVATDLPLLQFMVSSAAELTPPHAPNLWRRYLALATDGLRTPDPHPLPQPGLGPDELDVAVRTARGRAA